MAAIVVRRRQGNNIIESPFIAGQKAIILVTTYTPLPEVLYPIGNGVWSIWCIPVWYETGVVVSTKPREVIVEVTYKYEVKRYVFKPDIYDFVWEHNNHGHNENRLLENYERSQLPI